MEAASFFIFYSNFSINALGDARPMIVPAT
jgi:hypothetical protein